MVCFYNVDKVIVENSFYKPFFSLYSLFNKTEPKMVDLNFGMCAQRIKYIKWALLVCAEQYLKSIK